MTPAASYDEPFFWWGPGWATDPKFGIVDLLRKGVIEPESGAIIWVALERRSSIVVIGEPSGLGKSTLLWALLAFLPPASRRIFIRGNFETFGFLEDSSVNPESSALLINEISPHLPVYAWGPVVSRLLDAETFGFQLAATAHARSITEFVSLLAGPPLRISMERIAAFNLVVLLEQVGPTAEGVENRGVTKVWRQVRTKSGVAIELLWGEPGGDISQKSQPNFQLRTPCLPTSEIALRSARLRDFRDGRVPTLRSDLSPDGTSRRSSKGRKPHTKP